MYISSRKFIITSILIILLPISAKWRLLVFGNKTKGVVVQHINTDFYNQTKGEYSLIQFETPKGKVEFVGPEDLIYPIGKEVIVYYNKKNPEKFLMFNFAGLFLTKVFLLPGLFLLFWSAFYLTMKQTYVPPKEKTKFLFSDKELNVRG
ncbi:MAG: hypothetical protein JXA77_09140 [Bacteroidales bacterium]|nr:hypothetical protein [Bacteroidales bacterium]MBN2819606.1 hypothetical protein [Bacteroidales bacterium]